MSDLGKFDAEQRENLRQFMEEVQSRAERASGTTVYPRSSNNSSSSGTSSYVGFNIDTSSTNSEDLQTMLDQLRAEIATLRTELNKYR
jgi:putative lipoic acid-binding regulatory protein